MDYICKDLHRSEKIAIKKEVVKRIRATGLIFMEKRTDELWYPVSSTKKIDRKVAQALRERGPQLRGVGSKDDTSTLNSDASYASNDSRNNAVTSADDEATYFGNDMQDAASVITNEADSAYGVDTTTTSRTGMVENVVSVDQEDMLDPLLEFGDMTSHHLDLPPMLTMLGAHQRTDDVPPFSALEDYSIFDDDVLAFNFTALED